MNPASRRIGLVLAGVLALSSVAQGQDLPCPQFPVNTETSYAQLVPSVASLAGGNFVVAWGSLGYTLGVARVNGRRFGPGGIPAGPEFEISASGDGQNYPGVAAATDGSFVVAWEDRNDTGVFNVDVRARGFDAAGVPQSEFVVNSYTYGYQGRPRIAAVGPPGEFVVAWASSQFDVRDIFARRFGPGGALGPEFQVNTFTTDLQLEAEVAASPAGGFVVTWTSIGPDGDAGGIMGRRYDAGGAPLGDEFLVNTYTTTHQRDSRAAFDAAGNLVVVWRSFREAGTSGIYARQFDAAGQARGPEFQVNTYTPGDQLVADVAFDSSGSFQVVWSGPDPGGDPASVRARRFNPDGQPEGPEFRLDSAGDPRGPSLAAMGNRGFVTAWSNGYGFSSSRIFASLDCARLYPVTPCRVADTRLPPGPSGGPRLPPNTVRFFPVTGTCNVPADARAVAVNVTAVNPTNTGFLSLYPAGQATPFTSTVNFAAGRTRAGNAVAPLGALGEVAVWCAMPAGSTGVDFALDVYGYFKR